MSDEGAQHRRRPRPYPQPDPPRRRVNRALLAAVLIVAVGVVVGVVVVLHRPDKHEAAGATAASTAPAPTFGASLPVAAPAAAAVSGDAELTDAATVTSVLDAATAAVQAVDTYDYRRLAAARAAGDKLSTGEFRQRYDQAFSGALSSSARTNRTVQQAVVEKSGITSLSATRAGVLVFGRLQVTDTDDPHGTTRALALGVDLTTSGALWQISAMTDLSGTGTFVATPPGNAGLIDAVRAGVAEVVDLLSYSRANFAADANRALAGLTGPLLTQQQTRMAALEDAMVSGGFDYAGTVRAVGVESAGGSSALLIVCATGYQVRAKRSPVSGVERFEVGVSYVSGRWLISEFIALPTSG